MSRPRTRTKKTPLRGPIEGLELRLTFDAGKHSYRFDKEAIPGITAILSKTDPTKASPLMWWGINKALETTELMLSPYLDGQQNLSKEILKNVLQAAKYNHRSVKEEAANMGKAAHGYIELAIKAALLLGKADGAAIIKAAHALGLPEAGPVKNAFDAFLSWAKAHDIEMTHSEVRVCHPEHWFAGTLDAIGFFEGKPCLFDWKTSGTGASYPSHAWQTAAYRAALLRSMGIATDMIKVVVFSKETAEPHPYTVFDPDTAYKEFRLLRAVYEGIKRKKFEEE